MNPQLYHGMYDTKEDFSTLKKKTDKKVDLKNVVEKLTD